MVASAFMKIRVIPCLLLVNWGIEKSIRFQDFVYVGSPINAARVFNGRNVDELILLDILATGENRGPRLEVIRQIADESLMPFTVGGGVRSVDDMLALLSIGADRVVVNSHAVENPDLVSKGAEKFGSQCIVGSIDVKRWPDGRLEVMTRRGQKPTGKDPVQWAIELERRGAGEILLNAIDRDGLMEGYDIELIRRVSEKLTIPLIACGGASGVSDFARAVDEGGASAVCAGAFFLFYGRRRTVLITYPSDQELANALGAERVRPKSTWTPFNRP